MRRYHSKRWYFFCNFGEYFHVIEHQPRLAISIHFDRSNAFVSAAAGKSRILLFSKNAKSNFVMSPAFNPGTGINRAVSGFFNRGESGATSNFLEPLSYISQYRIIFINSVKLIILWGYYFRVVKIQFV